MNALAKQHILLGVTGGIAAYKSAELIRQLKEAGASVKVVMTSAAKAFMTPLTLQALSGEPVYDTLLDEKAEYAMSHIALARWADWILVAPASADFIARIAHGHADDLLTTLCLATSAPIMIVPAMNRLMWENAATQNNVGLLRARGVVFLGPEAGFQACGEVGLGRMTEPNDIVAHLATHQKTDALKNKRILITAGPTHEPIDPVRYITNKSSGKMGYALAAAALSAGAKVHLISGPVTLTCDQAIERKMVQTAEEMHAKVMEQIAQTDIFIAAAAVADYRVDNISQQKIKKTSNEMDLHLIKNIDILASVAALSHPPFTVGFAAETDNLLKRAKEKRAAKNVDVLLANDVSQKNKGFDVNDNEIIALWKNKTKKFPLTTKTRLANELMTFITERYYEKHPT